MKATITKIDPVRVGRDNRKYRLTCFKLDTGVNAISFICEGMKNYAKWDKLLEVGNILDGMKMYNDRTIDADKSDPVLFFKPEKQTELF